MAASLRVATYNVHGCVGTDGQRSETRIAEVIAEMSADVVGLQEVEVGRARSGKIDQPAVIAERLGWHCLFVPAMIDGDALFGNAILSRAPLISKRRIPLMGVPPWFCREERAAMWAEAATALGPIQIFNTHLGLGRAERWTQARQLAGGGAIADVPLHSPAILLGDLNCRPRSTPVHLLASALSDPLAATRGRWEFPTFPAWLPFATVDHILVGPALRVTRLFVHRSALSRRASDHLPLVAELETA